MTRTTKALLLSTLLFPGCGHLLLNRFKTALVLIAVSIVAIVNLGSSLVNQAQTIADKILSGEIAANLEAISQAAAQQPVEPSNQLAVLAFFLCWLIGIIDSYRCAKQLKN